MVQAGHLRFLALEIYTMPDEYFSPSDCWKALILYGLNQATYKIALGKTLLTLSAKGYNRVPWDVLASEFFEQYRSRLDVPDRMPQQATPGRQTHVERIFGTFQLRQDIGAAIDEVRAKAFEDVIPRFHNLGFEVQWNVKHG